MLAPLLLGAPRDPMEVVFAPAVRLRSRKFKDRSVLGCPCPRHLEVQECPDGPRTTTAEPGLFGNRPFKLHAPATVMQW